MATLKALVKGGRLVLDEPSNLPEGTVVELVEAGQIPAAETDEASVPAVVERALGASKRAPTGRHYPLQGSATCIGDIIASVDEPWDAGR